MLGAELVQLGRQRPVSLNKQRWQKSGLTKQNLGAPSARRSMSAARKKVRKDMENFLATPLRR